MLSHAAKVSVPLRGIPMPHIFLSTDLLVSVALQPLFLLPSYSILLIPRGRKHEGACKHMCCGSTDLGYLLPLLLAPRAKEFVFKMSKVQAGLLPLSPGQGWAS